MEHCQGIKHAIEQLRCEHIDVACHGERLWIAEPVRVIPFVVTGDEMITIAQVTHRKQIQPGDVFTRLTVDHIAGNASNGGRKWLCTCACGNTKVVSASDLNRGDTQSCGCLQKERSRESRLEHRTDLTGMQLGQTAGLVLGPSDHFVVRKNSNRAQLWRCQCECGAEFLARGDKLRNGKLQHCVEHRRIRRKRCKQTGELPYTAFAALRERIKAGGRKALTNDEHDDLIARTARGESRACELLMMAHAGLIYMSVNGNRKRKIGFANIDTDETMQEARLWLVKTARQYDPSKGEFSTILNWCLKASNNTANSGDPMIHVSRNYFMCRDKQKHLDKQALAAARKVVSIDAPIDEEGRTYEEVVPSNSDSPETACAAAETQALCHEALHVLDERERSIIEARYLDGTETILEEIAQKYGVTRERVRQLEARALRKMRQYLERTMGNGGSPLP